MKDDKGDSVYAALVRFIAHIYRRIIRYIRQKYQIYKLKKTQKSEKIPTIQTDNQKDIKFLKIKRNGSVHADLSKSFIK